MAHQSIPGTARDQRTSDSDQTVKSVERGIRSKSRVRNLGEVFTPKKVVDDMLDMVDHKAREIESRFLEPSCGTGNFLVEILRRKLRTVGEVSQDHHSLEFNSLLALSSIYGVDIDKENVAESRQRMKSILCDFLDRRALNSKYTQGFQGAIDYVLKKNIVCGDFLDGQHKIFFTEFSVTSNRMLKQRIFRLSDLRRKGLLEAAQPRPVGEKSEKNYWEIAGQ